MLRLDRRSIHRGSWCFAASCTAPGRVDGVGPRDRLLTSPVFGLGHPPHMLFAAFLGAILYRAASTGDTGTCGAAHLLHMRLQPVVIWPLLGSRRCSSKPISGRIVLTVELGPEHLRHRRSRSVWLSSFWRRFRPAAYRNAAMSATCSARKSATTPRRSWLGTIVLIRPMSFTLLTAVGGERSRARCVALRIVGEYTRKARVAGVLAPEQGVVKILAQQAGVVESVLVARRRRGRTRATLMVARRRARGRPREDVASAVRSPPRCAERLRSPARARSPTPCEPSRRARGAALAGLDARAGRQLDARSIASSSARRARAALAGASGAHATSTGSASSPPLRSIASATRARPGVARSTRCSGRASSLRETPALEFETDARARARPRRSSRRIDAQRAALDQERLERGAAVSAPSIVGARSREPSRRCSSSRARRWSPGTPLAHDPSRGLDARGAPLRAVALDRLRARRPGGAAALPRLSRTRSSAASARASLAVSRNAVPPAELGFTPPDGSREPLYRIKVALESQSDRRLRPRASPCRPACRSRPTSCSTGAGSSSGSSSRC